MRGEPKPDESFLDDIAPHAIAHMNDDHGAALLAYVQAFGGARWADAAQLVELHPTGMVLVARAGERRETVWVPFETPLTSPNQVRPVLVRLVQRARDELANEEKALS